MCRSSPSPNTRRRRRQPADAAGKVQTEPKSQEGLGGDIRIEFTPNGMLIASDDTEALDRFEDILRTVAGPTDSHAG